MGRRRLISRRRVGGAPDLLQRETFSRGPTGGAVRGEHTCRVLHVRLNAANLSVGELARYVLVDSERDPPIKRDHYRRLAKLISNGY